MQETSSSFPTVISFYTKEAPYPQAAKNLLSSCKQFGLEHVVEEIESFGTWELNCAFKPFYIFQKLQEFKKPVLWVDADTVFKQKPLYLDLFSADLAVPMHPEFPANHPDKVMTHTLYVNFTESAIQIIRLWAKECMRRLTEEEHDETFWDGVALRDILANQSIARILPLPASFLHSLRSAA